jgi:hypothetical protein
MVEIMKGKKIPLSMKDILASQYLTSLQYITVQLIKIKCMKDEYISSATINPLPEEGATTTVSTVMCDMIKLK